MILNLYCCIVSIEIPASAGQKSRKLRKSLLAIEKRFMRAGDTDSAMPPIGTACTKCTVRAYDHVADLRHIFQWYMGIPINIKKCPPKRISVPF
jgi:hypothetical protein